MTFLKALKKVLNILNQIDNFMLFLHEELDEFGEKEPHGRGLYN